MACSPCLFRPMFGLISKSWHMFPLGFLEVASRRIPFEKRIEPELEVSS